MVTKLTEGLWHIDCRTRDKPNAFVVDDGKWTLIDSGWPGDATTIREGFQQIECSLEEIERVLLTHYDADHVGALGKLTPALDAPIYIHEKEAPYVAGERLPPWTARKGLEALHRLYYRQLDLPDLPVEELQHGDEIDDFRTMHTPGHTPGHVVYVHEELDAVFLGDLVINWNGQLRPADRFTSYDRSQVEESIRLLSDRISDVTYVCPGHGQPLTNGSRSLSQLME